MLKVPEMRDIYYMEASSVSVMVTTGTVPTMGHKMCHKTMKLLSGQLPGP